MADNYKGQRSEVRESSGKMKKGERKPLSSAYAQMHAA